MARQLEWGASLDLQEGIKGGLCHELRVQLILYRALRMLAAGYAVCVHVLQREFCKFSILLSRSSDMTWANILMHGTQVFGRQVVVSAPGI